MKIVQVVPYFYPAWSYGGPAKLAFDTSSFFSKQGHEIVVLSTDAYTKDETMPLSKKLKPNKNLCVKYYHLISNNLAFKYRIFLSPNFFLDSIKYVYSADIIHLHDFFTLQNAWIFLLAKIFNKPFVISPHGTLKEKTYAQRSAFKKIFMELFGLNILNSAKKVILSSKQEAKELKKIFSRKKSLAFIGHGMNIDEFKSKISKTEAKNKLNIPQNKVVLTFLGRINRLKGIDLLLELIKKNKDNKKLFFIIAGSDDGYLAETKMFIRENKLKNVKLMGVCFGEKKNNLFKASDVFIYPSYSEGFSVGILEAAAAGLALLITDGCNFDDVETYNAGIVCKAKIDDLNKAISKMLNRKKLVLMKSNSKQLIREKYTMSVVGNQLLKLYENSITN